ncbi:MAG TPA: ParB/RepB/Spo0J family partition protein [Anaerolineales bacterium]|nr:ParB/RepB/Spo0J family partition protein [Anaerolineales bacterium]HNQ95515.1 ParB/RepB/Spo0J family partition protein [Anaerolineales bacterium]HNS61998.1 ParB/RepB/Spo0J family partition protein [Anaerolineales bacterium]
MAKRTGLGKGLDALIPGGKISAGGEAGGVTQVSIDSIQRNPRQPREKFDTTELENLAASIREHGVIQPLIVSPGRGGSYTLIAGERRLQASRKAGLKTVPVVIRSATDQQLLELALIENVQRADLNPIEEAEAYQNLAKEFRMSHETIATRVGKSRVAVTNTLRLLDASAAVKQALVDGRISEGHARAMLSLSAKAQEHLLKQIINLDLSVRSTEMLARKLSGNRPVVKKKSGRSPNVSDVEKKLQSSLGTKVALKHGKRGGTVTIYYYSDEELDSLLEKLT